MPAIRRILVAVKDPAARRQPAVAKAAQLAAGLGAQLELFHAICEPLFVDAALMTGKPLKVIEDEWQARHLGRLERLAAKLRADGLKVTTACDWDHPAFEAVVRRAQQARADLIVAERHATRHVAPWLLRFNDWELLRRSAVPVLLVKSGRPWQAPRVLAAIDPRHAFAKPARLDAAILDAGAAVATALGGKLHAVHAFVPTMLDVRQLDLDDPNLAATIESRAAAQARGAFERALEPFALPKAQRHLVARHPVDAIPATARKLRAAIVVMGAVSRSGLKRLIVGDTAEQILDALPHDVLVVKPASFVSRVPGRSRGVQLIASARRVVARGPSAASRNRRRLGGGPYTRAAARMARSWTTRKMVRWPRRRSRTTTSSRSPRRSRAPAGRSTSRRASAPSGASRSAR